MVRKLRYSPIVLFLLAAAALLASAACARQTPLPGGLVAPPDSLAALQPVFADPPAEFRSAPLWVWNDRMTAAEIDGQLSDFKSKGIGGVFVHPRPGLITPYLSEEWLGLFKHAVETGKSLGLKIWIYDENSYPSGFAGGHVPAAMPDAVRTGLRLTKLSVLPEKFESEPIVVLSRTAAGFVDVTVRMKELQSSPGDYYVFDLHRQKPNPWYGGFTYVDLMRSDVTAKFLEVTLDAYKKAFGADFGATVPGTFQDEAEINPAGGEGMIVVNWTPRLFEAFRDRWGYDLKPNLLSLFEEIGDWARIRHDFYAVLLDLFVSGWAKPYHEYCERNNLAFTGHYWEHEWPRPAVGPDSMAMESWSHMPGIDILMNDFHADVHAQFGNARAVKELRSVANQMGLPRTMSETFGAGGWDMTFFDQKRIADWEYALGVNFMNQHLSYATIMGARKRDHPQSFSYHEPWWDDYKILGDYFGRLTVALSAGRQDNRILVIEPTTTAWMAFAPGIESDAMAALGKDFQDFVNGLESAQVEYDLGSEAILRDQAKIDGAALAVGPQKYALVVFPPRLENIELPTYTLLEKFLKKGGRILAWREPPKYIDGRLDSRPRELAAAHPADWITIGPENWEAMIREHCPPDLEFRFEGAPAAAGPRLLFHHRRTLRDGELVFLANTDPSAPIRGEMIGPGRSCRTWDAMTGWASASAFEPAGAKVKVRFDIPPGGSLIVVLSPDAAVSETVSEPAWSAVKALGPTRVVRAGDNVLTLDYCDLTVAGKTEKDLYFYDAQLRTYRAHGLDRNPWDSAVQYKTNILDKDKFPPDSGFAASFRFRVGAALKTPLAAVVERPALFRVFFNGQPIEPIAGRWRLDKAFGVYSLDGLKAGENVITVAAKPFTIHSELEPVYLLGDFALQSDARGFAVVPAKPVAFGSWAKQGLPMFAGTMNYAKKIDWPADRPKDARCRVVLGAWKGSAAEVLVNGKKAGLVAFAPFDLDITDALEPGENEIVVAVIGTLKNMLGPFHNNPPLGMAWPSSFQHGAKDGRPAGKDYSVVDYGLFEDFRVEVGRR